MSIAFLDYPYVSARVRQPVLRHGRKPAQLNRAQIRVLRAAERLAQRGERVTQAQIAAEAGRVPSKTLTRHGSYITRDKFSQGYIAKLLPKLEELGFIRVKGVRGRYGGTWITLGVFNRLRYWASQVARRVWNRNYSNGEQETIWGENEFLPRKAKSGTKRKTYADTGREITEREAKRSKHAQPFERKRGEFDK